MKNNNPFRLDDGLQLLFQNQTEKAKAKTYDIKYPNLKARVLIPPNFDAGEGTNTISYYQYDMVGFAKIVTNYAKDFPKVSIKGKKFTGSVRSLGDSYGWDIQEARSALMAGIDLPIREAGIAKRTMYFLENQIAFFGDANFDLQGFLSNPNIPSGVVLNDGAAGATTFVSKTPDQIIRDINELINNVISVTKGVEVPDTVLLPVSIYTMLNTTAKSSNSDTTILQFLKNAHPEIKLWDWLNELETAGPAQEKMMVAYRRDPEVLELEVPVDFEQFTAQVQGLEYNIPCHMRCGGVKVYYPLACNKKFGI